MTVVRDEALYLLCRLVAEADGDVGPDKVAAIERRMDARGMHLSPEARMRLDAVASDRDRRGQTMDEIVSALPQPSVRADALCTAVEIVWADREMDIAALDALQDLAVALAGQPLYA